MSDNTDDNTNTNINMINEDQLNKQTPKNKTYAETTTGNKNDNKPNLPLFSSLVPLNETLPHVFPANNPYFHTFYNYVLPQIRSFRPGNTSFDKVIDTLAIELPDQLISGWKENIDLSLFSIPAAKRKFITKNLASLLN